MSDTSEILRGADAAWTLAIETLRAKGHDEAADLLAGASKPALRLQLVERCAPRGLPRDWSEQLDTGAAEVDAAMGDALRRLGGKP